MQVELLKYHNMLSMPFTFTSWWDSAGICISEKYMYWDHLYHGTKSTSWTMVSTWGILLTWRWAMLRHSRSGSHVSWRRWGCPRWWWPWARRTCLPEGWTLPCICKQHITTLTITATEKEAELTLTHWSRNKMAATLHTFQMHFFTNKKVKIAMKIETEICS